MCCRTTTRSGSMGAVELCGRGVRRSDVSPARLVALAAVALTLAGCGASAGTSATSSSATSPSAASAVIELDGALRAVPVDGQDPQGTVVQASRTLEVLSLQHRWVTAYETPVLARVTWTAATDSSGPTAPLPAQDSLDWVLVFHTPSSPAPACPYFSPDPTPPGGVSDADAIIVDATTGAAAVYAGRRCVCGHWTTPRVAPAHRYWSIPWTKAGPTTVTVTAPPCGVVAGSATDNDRMSVIAAGPIDATCSGARTTAVTGDITSTDWKHLVHAPVGILCSEPAPGLADVGVDLPAVPGCVRLR